MEIENKFEIVKKGYDPHAVDARISSLVAENRYLQGRIEELEKRIRLSEELMSNFSRAEDGLRQSIADSKKAAASMILDAKTRSAALLDDARAECGRIVAELDRAVAGRAQVLSALKTRTKEFKAQLFDLYSQHIALVESIAEVTDRYEAPETDYTAIADAVDAFEAAGAPEAEVPAFEEYPEESIFGAFGEPEDLAAPENASAPDPQTEPMPEEIADADETYEPVPDADEPYAPEPDADDEMFDDASDMSVPPMDISYGEAAELHDIPQPPAVPDVPDATDVPDVPENTFEAAADEAGLFGNLQSPQPDPEPAAAPDHTALFDALAMPAAGAADPDDDFFAAEGEDPLGDAVYDFDAVHAADPGLEKDESTADYYRFLSDFIHGDDRPSDEDNN